jgi:hypothetical protein
MNTTATRTVLTLSFCALTGALPSCGGSKTSDEIRETGGEAGATTVPEGKGGTKADGGAETGGAQSGGGQLGKGGTASGGTGATPSTGGRATGGVRLAAQEEAVRQLAARQLAARRLAARGRAARQLGARLVRPQWVAMQVRIPPVWAEPQGRRQAGPRGRGRAEPQARQRAARVVSPVGSAVIPTASWAPAAILTQGSVSATRATRVMAGGACRPPLAATRPA